MRSHDTSWLIEHLNSLKKQSQFRSLSPIQAREGTMALLEEKAYLNLSGNDYLGLATRMDLQNEFQTQHLLPALEKPGLFTSSSSRLLTGNHALYTSLEEQLSRWSGMESALVFSSGYHANLGIIPALASHGDIIFSDKLNHASIQDALKLSDTKFIRYPHLDYDKLESLLKIHRSTHKKALIVSESLFSMDGDRADLKRLVELKNRYNCMLYVDEAHAAGVFGDKGIGLCEEEGILNEVDILVGTFGKALASFGAYALCSLAMKDYLINTARSLIFTTALPP
ncbi:MAG: 8-amino-7-oxononanoate synthase, partial [Spirochaetae bacterium HGW-Spirochaetae-6]